MYYNHINKRDQRELVRNLFQLSFSKDDIPFHSIILPQGFPTIAYVFGDKQSFTYKEKEKFIKGLIITGQFYGTYDYYVKEESFNIGIVLHPTALYKIFKTDVSKYTV